MIAAILSAVIPLQVVVRSICAFLFDSENSLLEVIARLKLLWSNLIYNFGSVENTLFRHTMERAQKMVKRQQQQQFTWPRSTSAQYITDEMLAPFVSSSGLLPTSQVELTLSCRNLINADIITKSDPYCVVWMQEPRWQDKYYEIGRTETIDDNLNPQWCRKFVFSYSFGIEIRFVIATQPYFE